jgi:hypothetical protein
MSQQVRKREEQALPVAFRTSPVVRDQLDQLMKHWGENQSQTLVRCIERAYLAEGLDNGQDWSAVAPKAPKRPARKKPTPVEA